MTLNDRELLVVATKIMRFSEEDALKYMAAHHHEISIATYYRILGKVQSSTRKRLYEIAKSMRELHMERIDELEKIRKEMWKNYHKDQLPIFKVRILKEIKEIQPYISAYHEATQHILEDTVKQYAKEENHPLSIFN